MALDEEAAVRAIMVSLGSATRSSMLEVGAGLLESLTADLARPLSVPMVENVLHLEILLRGTTPMWRIDEVLLLSNCII